MTEEIQPTSTQVQSPEVVAEAPSAALASLEQREKDLNDQVERFQESVDKQNAERDALTKEIATKQGQVAQLDADILAKTKQIAEQAEKPASAASQTLSGKLEYFEAEVARLGGQLTQQKVSYDRQVKELQQKLAALDSKDSAAAPVDACEQVSTMEADRLADQLNEEVSTLAFDVPNNYDWKVVQLVQSASKQMAETLDRVLGATASVDESQRAVFRKLDTRLHLCTGQLQKHLLSAPAGNSAEIAAKNEKIAALEAQLAALQRDKPTVTPEEVTKMEALAAKLESSKERLSSGGSDGASAATAEVLDALCEAHELMSAAVSRVVAGESLSVASVGKLSVSLTGGVAAVKDAFEKITQSAQSQQNEAQTASQTEIDKLKKRLGQIEEDLESKDRTLLEQETQMLALTDQVEESQKVEENLRERIAEMEELELKAEEAKNELLDQLKERDGMVDRLESLKGQADDENAKLQELLGEADGQLRQVEQRMAELEQENEGMQQRFQQNELLVASVKKDFQQILNYKSDLEVLVEDQTQHIEGKNQRLYQMEEQRVQKDTEIENLEGQVRRQTAMADENRKKLLQAEVKLRQLTQATLKDLRAKVKDKNAEIEVLKEMVKSANMQAKSKDIDVSRLQKKINRLERGGADAASNYGGSRRGRDGDGSVSSRQSRLGGGHSPAPQNNMNNNLIGLDGTIPERDAELEQTGLYDQRYNGVPQQNLPPMTKTRQQEWEEAVELDRILEQERNAVSKATMQRKQETNYNEYMERISNPSVKNASSGLSGVLGAGGASPYYNNAMGSLPDLKQSKRESLEAELLGAEPNARTVGRQRGRSGVNGSIGAGSNRGRF